MQYNILTTRAMGPSAEVVVFYVKSDGEIVLDHTIIAINDFFENKVSFSISLVTNIKHDCISI